MVASLSGLHRLDDLLECAGLPRSTYYYALSHVYVKQAMNKVARAI